tara:strand:- start:47 stop:391 length:345 start_codon:yes stop_codon:yes gene_type:complete
MPKVTYTEAKGLVQATGAGFNINSITTVTATGNLDATTFLTIADNSFTNNNELTLPASADTGAIKIIISDTANNVKILGDNATTATADTTLTNIGDFAICIYNGTEWVVGRSLT